ncbi:serine/threonine protein kinase [Cyanobacteria bacterium FACHB-63]|nr:serine/threonine protein kinase [Cyanobacteria bacterium FACHB-63]
MSSSFRYPEYYCSRNSPLSCDQPQATVEHFKGAKFCQECGFPIPLTPQQQIQGRRGTYQVKKLLGARGGGRLYAAVQVGSGQFVLIKEYLLPNRCFSPEQVRQRKELFSRIAGLTPADGRLQDFRVLSTLEAIADPQSDRALLVTQQKEAFPTLAQYLSERGAMSAAQVREVLAQTLQTLQFLHSQKFRRPSGQMDQGIVHGNISLESLLINGNADQFHIYLCDLAEWEFLFLPAPSATKPQAIEDLTALGNLGFYLLNGNSKADPRDDRVWVRDDPALKQFLLQLMGLEAPFESAEAARQALLQLPQPESVQHLGIATPLESTSRISKVWWLLIAAIALLLLGGGLFYFLRPHSNADAQSFAKYKRLPSKTFSEVSGVSAGQSTYVSQKEGTWTVVLGLRPEASLLGDRLTRPVPNTEAIFNHKPLDIKPSLQENAETFAAIAAVQNRQADFAISSLSDPPPDNADQAQIAYDGLLVFVPFSKKAQNLPQALQGRIRLEDLRKLFTGEIKNWKELTQIDLPVVVHAPTEPEALRQFQQRVLNGDAQAIAKFQQIAKQQRTEDTQRQMVNDFDAGQAGIVSFGILSKTWDQCNGYPLAIVDDQGTVSQPLMRTQTERSITPTDNLCDKNNRLDVELFRSKQYRLGYPLLVVYPKDNRTTTGRQFAALLTDSQQGQCLLKKVGLVPLQPVPDICP